MKALFSLTLFTGMMLPLIILGILYGWLRKRTSAPNYWPMTTLIALALGTLRTILVYGGFYLAANPFMPTPLRFIAIICGMLTLPESALLLRLEAPNTPHETQRMILTIVTFTGAIIWTIGLAALARWMANAPVTPDPPPESSEETSDAEQTDG